VTARSRRWKASRCWRAAKLAGVPAVEVRAVSNEIDEPDRERWRLDDALAALDAALPRLPSQRSADEAGVAAGGTRSRWSSLLPSPV